MCKFFFISVNIINTRITRNGKAGSMLLKIANRLDFDDSMRWTFIIFKTIITYRYTKPLHSNCRIQQLYKQPRITKLQIILLYCSILLEIRGLGTLAYNPVILFRMKQSYQTDHVIVNIYMQCSVCFC